MHSLFSTQSQQPLQKSRWSSAKSSHKASLTIGLLFTAIVISGLPAPAWAWLTAGLSAVTTGLSAAAQATVVGTPVAAWGYGAQVVGFIGACGGLDDFPPGFVDVGPPKACPASVVTAVFDPGITYPHITTSDPNLDAVGNTMIDQFNVLTTSFSTGASQTQILAEAHLLGQYTLALGTYIQAQFAPIVITPAQYYAAIDDIAANGLPQDEENFLIAAGWSSQAIADFGDLVGSMDASQVTFNEPSVNLDLAIRTIGEELATASFPAPEPSTLLLMTFGLAGLGWRTARHHGLQSL